MDTKLKTFKISKITIIVFSLIFIISISTILSYKNIRKNTLKNNLSILYDDSILNDIRIGNQELYRDIRENKDLNIRQDPRADYYVLDEKNDTEINTFNNKDIVYEDFMDNRVIKEYDLLIKVTYDEDGGANVEFKSGNETVGSYINADEIKEIENEEIKELGYGYEPIKNMTFIYGVENIVTSGFNQTYLYNKLKYKYEEMAYRYISVGLILVILFGLVIPYRKEKELFMMKRLIKAPLDIKAALIIFNIIMYICSIWIIVETISGLVSGGLYLKVGNYEISTLITIILNIVIFLVVYITLFYNVVIVKSIKREENSRNTLISIGIKKLNNSIEKIDLRKFNKKRAIILLIINLIIVSLLSLFWFFGIIGALLYTVFLYILIRGNIKKFNNEYKLILDSTSMITKGDLDYKIEEDFLWLDSLKDDVLYMKSSFIKSIEEEIKNQNMKGELLSNISKDLNTPVDNIEGYIAKLKDDNLSYEERIRYIEKLEKKSYEFKRLIEDLFEVSKANSGSIKLDLNNVDIVALIKQTIIEEREKLDNSSLKLNLKVPSEKVILKLDGQRTYKVFENLIENIVKYSLKNTRVYIEVKEEKERVYIIFKNISKDPIKEFYRKGIGLQIVKGFIEVQGGNFDIEIDGDLFKAIIYFNVGVN
ncbi:HAMP domain-containing sensor histidine kinase [Clostridium baratii]|uniref:sensor histidine kinase n=1 Tax=Clostridium baratii TaxID=1561 RepID=UPI0029037D4B|nr:HAMP domain-containing sensor histidine kinase [Clostridium baratii]MDU1053181.1 HAMP domain-containing sensor histidine kinase [Clostridium baratii]MDU4911290.1 HAMP domain-containing sensor histidine kinase [Clostridium baratii]